MVSKNSFWVWTSISINWTKGYHPTCPGSEQNSALVLELGCLSALDTPSILHFKLSKKYPVILPGLSSLQLYCRLSWFSSWDAGLGLLSFYKCVQVYLIVVGYRYDCHICIIPFFSAPHIILWHGILFRSCLTVYLSQLTEAPLPFFAYYGPDTWQYMLSLEPQGLDTIFSSQNTGLIGISERFNLPIKASILVGLTADTLWAPIIKNGTYILLGHMNTRRLYDSVIS